MTKKRFVFQYFLICFTVHGTHIVGIIASSGISSKGKYKGISQQGPTKNRVKKPDLLTGTSMAAPIVSGVVALLL